MIPMQTGSKIPETGYEDIWRPEPYYDIEVDGDRLLLHMFYVPPHLRGQGVGKRLFEQLLDEVDQNVSHIRLKACALGSGCTLAFWRSCGFSSAYGQCNGKEEERILHRGVNGRAIPQVESLSDGSERHWIFD